MYKVEVGSDGGLVKRGRTPSNDKKEEEEEEDPILARLRSFSPSLAEHLKDFSLREEERRFAAEAFGCGVCFEEKAGANCLRFRGELDMINNKLDYLWEMKCRWVFLKYSSLPARFLPRVHGRPLLRPDTRGPGQRAGLPAGQVRRARIP